MVDCITASFFTSFATSFLATCLELFLISNMDRAPQLAVFFVIQQFRDQWNQQTFPNTTVFLSLEGEVPHLYPGTRSQVI